MAERRPCELRGLYAIIDHPDPHGLDPVERARALVAGGARCLQLRAKTATAAERMALTLALAPVAAELGVPFVINDDLAIALAGIRGLTGLHLGQEDLARHGAAGGGAQGARATRSLRRATADQGLWLGVSTHDLTQAREAAALGADYIGVGPVFPTHSKAAPDPLVGLEGLARVTAELATRDERALPVVAIGGIDAARAGRCFEAGATAVAVISGLVAPTPDAVRAKALEFSASCSILRADGESTNLG